jgi:universal stress protein A
MSFDRILVPVDFSHHSDSAIRAALVVAARHQSRITLLHVDPLPAPGFVAVEPIYLPQELWESLYRDHSAATERSLDDLVAELEPRRPPDVEITGLVRRGEVIEEILSCAAEDGGFDLIVMGSHGLTGAARFLLGSVTEKVSRRATCPVLITRADQDDGKPAVGSMRRALAAIDYSHFSEPVARLAAELVGPDGLVELAHVWPASMLSALDARLSGRRDEVAEAMDRGRGEQVRMLERFLGDIDLPPAEIALFVGIGNPSRIILERADDTSPDVIVVGAHSHENLREALIGTVAERILRHAPVPVLLLPATAL